jgi:hypothetical protein
LTPRPRGAGYFGAVFFGGGAGTLLTIGGWMGAPNTRRLVGWGAKELTLWGVPTGWWALETTFGDDPAC